MKIALGRCAKWPQVDVQQRLQRRNLEPFFAPPEEIQRMINIA